MAFELNTLHIFGYGETQIIGKDGKEGESRKVSTTLVAAAAQAVVDNIYSKKPADNTSVNEYHLVTIFNGTRGDYQPKEKNKGWRVEWKDVDAALVNALVAEVLAIPVPADARPNL